MAASIAYFISPHGFGHAARAASIMSALGERLPQVHIHVFTRVPEWFFSDSCNCSFEYHSLLTDIGLVQSSALHENLSRTVQVLDDFLPFDDDQTEELAKKVKEAGCRLVICDVAPMGIAVAKRAGIPSLLTENFTWDWIYRGYETIEPGLKKHADYLEEVFGSADYLVQTEPVCEYRDPELITAPVSRQTRIDATELRRKLGLSSGHKIVMLTMGGTEQQYPFLDMLSEYRDIHFVIPGGSDTIRHDGNLILLPFHSSFYHPDLVNASNGVIGKLGYSTLAEAYNSGVPFGYITRSRFAESPVLAEFVQKHMQGFSITDKEFEEGSFLSRVRELVDLPRMQRTEPNGAIEAARFIAEKIS